MKEGDKKDKLRKIEKLEKQLKELKEDYKKDNPSEDEINGKIEKALSESHKGPLEVKNEGKKYIRTLALLIIIIIIIDAVFLIAYYKPDFSGIFKANEKPADNSNNNGLKCSDGTFYGQCSKNKPYYCYNGELLKKATTCGCPAGSKVDFQGCKKA